MRGDSVVRGYFDRVPALGHFARTAPEPGTEHGRDVASMVAFLHEVAERRTIDRRALLSEWLVPAMARQHVHLFDACVAGHRKSS
jgi:hypothetical protein